MVFEVDPITGDRTIVSSAAVGSGQNLERPEGIAIAANGDLVVADQGPSSVDAVVRIDPTTGNRTVVSKASVGGGPNFSDVRGVAVESTGDILVVDIGLEAVLRVDPCTGDRTIVSSSAVGNGTDFDQPRGIAIVAAAASDCGNGVLDAGEQCDDGNLCAGDCCSPTCQFEPSTTVCRDSAGACDPAEACTGTSATCPVDSKSTAVCRSSAGDCDAAESCDGVSDNCPGDAKSNAVCRPVAGDCDLAESCDGVGNDCPADGFEPSTAVCRASVGACDLEETCTGSSPSCGPDLKSGAVCRPAAGACDVAESCDDVSNDCPADGFLDTDGDTVPDACDVCSGGNDLVDTDADTVPDACDVCPGGDDLVDTDADTVPDACDVCPGGDDLVDTDADTVPDACDVCPGFGRRPRRRGCRHGPGRRLRQLSGYRDDPTSDGRGRRHESAMLVTCVPALMTTLVDVDGDTRARRLRRVFGQDSTTTWMPTRTRVPDGCDVCPGFG